MKLKVKTVTLQAMFMKAAKAANQNKLIPLTSLVNINKVGNKLILTTTYNMDTYLYSIANNIEGDDFYVTVGIEQIGKLISKMTCEDIELELKENTLEVKGNGKYSIEIPLDENGDMIKFPDPYRDIHPEDTEDIEFTDVLAYSDIQKTMNTLKPSLATTMEEPVLINYFAGDIVCATNRDNVTAYNKRLFNEVSVLIAPEVMGLMTLLTQDEIDVKITDEYMLFVTDDTILYSTILPDVEDYPAEGVNGVIAQPLPYKCDINKNKILALLDRISIFVPEYDLNVISLAFGPNSLTVSNTSSSSDEVLEYENKTKNKDWEGRIDIVGLINHLKTCLCDTIQIEYGNEDCIKIIDGDIVKILMLCE